MSTTIVTTWATDIAQLGPVYPFVGSEFILWIVGLVFWLGFHLLQLKNEKTELEDEEQASHDPEVVMKAIESEK